MTSTEEIEEDLATDALDPDELARFPEAIAKLQVRQPTFALLDPAEANWIGQIDSGQHMITLAPEVTGLLDVNEPRFTPSDAERVRVLLVARLTELHGSAPVPFDGGADAVDWTTVQVLSEGDGVLRLSATGAPGEDGAAYGMTLELNAALEVTSATSERPAPEAAPEPGADATPEPGAGDETTADAAADASSDVAAPAEAAPAEAAAPEITGDYLNQYYAGTELSHDGRAFRVEWPGWRTDQVTAAGESGSWLMGTTAAGGSYQIYVLFSPATGPRIAEVRVLQEAPAPVAAQQQPQTPAITAAYLGQYYTGAEFPHDGRGYVVDWQTWETNQTTPEGLSGSWADATTAAGGSYKLYVWFDPKAGPTIAQAQELAPPPSAGAAEEQVSEADQAQAQFESSIVPMLRDYWLGNGSIFTSVEGNTYDVSGFTDLNSAYPLDFIGFDGSAYLGRLITHNSDEQKVACELRITERDSVYVLREENAY